MNSTSIPARPRAATTPTANAQPGLAPRGPEPSGLTPGEIRRIVLDLLG